MVCGFIQANGIGYFFRLVQFRGLTLLEVRRDISA